VPWWTWFAVAFGGLVLLYLAFVALLVVAGRREDARALAGFIPDCAVLTGRLLRDGRVPRRHKLLLVGLLAYLALPFDLVPDFVPVAGQLDDVLVTAIVLRAFLRAGGEGPAREHWPGPQRSFDLVLRLAGSANGMRS
jgi:hypothetical protein